VQPAVRQLGQALVPVESPVVAGPVAQQSPGPLQFHRGGDQFLVAAVAAGAGELQVEPAAQQMQFGGRQPLVAELQQTGRVVV